MHVHRYYIAICNSDFATYEEFPGSLKHVQGESRVSVGGAGGCGYSVSIQHGFHDARHILIRQGGDQNLWESTGGRWISWRKDYFVVSCEGGGVELSDGWHLWGSGVTVLRRKICELTGATEAPQVFRP